MPITSSSTSSSEAAAPSGAAWRGFAAAFAAAAAVVYVALVAGLLALDPYDTGRFALVRTPGLAVQGPRTAGASRGRDTRFDGAVIGNSHVQLVSPARLAESSGIPFVSLAIPGTGPQEQLLLIDYFLRHRTRPARALVLGIDEFWCTKDETLATWNPFPFWLYGRSEGRYVLGLARFQTFDDAIRRIQYITGTGRHVRARPDGFWDYDETFVWLDERHGAFVRQRSPSGVLNETGRFPALDALATRLAEVPRDLPVVLVRPPVALMSLAEPGTPLARAEAACRARLQGVAAGRPGTALVDWRVDRPEVHEDRNFIDPTHYRTPVARALEQDIAAALPRPARPGG